MSGQFNEFFFWFRLDRYGTFSAVFPYFEKAERKVANPGSCAFLIPGSGQIRDNFLNSGSWIPNPQPHICERFWVKKP
jgi:hypothetical protein